MKPTYAELERIVAEQDLALRLARKPAPAPGLQVDRITRRALANAAKAHKRAQRADRIIAAHTARGFELEKRLAESRQRTAHAHARNDKLRKEVEALRGTHPDRRADLYAERFADSRQGSGFTFRKPDDTHIEAAEPYSYDAYLAAVGNMGFGRVIAWNNPGYTIVAKAAPKRRIVNRAHRLTPNPRRPLSAWDEFMQTLAGKSAASRSRSDYVLRA